MSVTQSKAAYQDCFDYFDRALEAKLGIRVAMRNPSEANNLRMRMNRARQISRQEMNAIHERGFDHPEFSTSPYDALVLKVREKPEGDWWLYIEPRKSFEIEELTDETSPEADADAG